MSRKIDITNQRFGRLIAKSVTRSNGSSYWSCKCDCGNKVVVFLGQLRAGLTKSCGCLQRETIGNLRRIHGKSGSRFYNIYKGINKRCNNPKEPGYKNYGGRGIKNEWKSFKDFSNDMQKTYKNSLTIERINNSGNYSKENCKWATMKEQGNNKRNNHKLKFLGKEMTIAEWSEHLGIKQSVLYRRSGLGWSINRMFNQPVRL